MTKKVLTNWEDETHKLANYFVKIYFGEDITEVWWISNEIGGTLAVNDYFFSLQDIVNFIKYNYSCGQMFSYYDYALKKIQTNKKPICIRDWKKLKKYDK